MILCFVIPQTRLLLSLTYHIYIPKIIHLFPTFFYYSCQPSTFSMIRVFFFSIIFNFTLCDADDTLPNWSRCTSPTLCILYLVTFVLLRSQIGSYILFFHKVIYLLCNGSTMYNKNRVFWQRIGAGTHPFYQCGALCALHHRVGVAKLHLGWVLKGHC